MNRLWKCTQFQMKSAIKSSLWFLGIYFAIYFLLYLLVRQLVLSSSGSGGGSMNSGFFFAGVIFMFVYIASSHKPNHNFLLLFGNTRKDIYLSAIITYSALSLVMAGISVAAQLVDFFITKDLSRSPGAAYTDFLTVIYGSDATAAAGFLWYFALFIMIFSLSMLYGALSYKFGKLFITVFWVGFGLCWTVVPIMAGLDGADTLMNAFQAYFCTGVSGGILLAPVNFLITAVIFSAAAYFISSRQPQVA